MDRRWKVRDIDDPLGRVVTILKETKDRQILQKYALWLIKHDPDAGLKVGLLKPQLMTLHSIDTFFIATHISRGTKAYSRGRPSAIGSDKRSGCVCCEWIFGVSRHTTQTFNKKRCWSHASCTKRRGAGFGVTFETCQQLLGPVFGVSF